MLQSHGAKPASHHGVLVGTCFLGCMTWSQTKPARKGQPHWRARLAKGTESPSGTWEWLPSLTVLPTDPLPLFALCSPNRCLPWFLCWLHLSEIPSFYSPLLNVIFPRPVVPCPPRSFVAHLAHPGAPLLYSQNTPGGSVMTLGVVLCCHCHIICSFLAI